MKKWGGGTKSRGRGTKSRGNNTMQWGSRMTSTLRPSLNNKLSFRLVDLTISFSIEHLTILSKLIHCIATYVANGVAARNSGDSSNLSHHYLFLGHLLELQYVYYH
jgi:hypothetical protein